MSELPPADIHGGMRLFHVASKRLVKMVGCVCAGRGVQHLVREEEQGGILILCVLPELRPQVLPYPG